MKRILQTLFFLIAGIQFSPARSEVSGEGVFAMQLEMAFHEFALEHPGKAPTSWPDLARFFHKPIDEVFPGILPSKRYAFLQHPLHMEGPHKGEILLIARKPFQELTSRENWYGGRSKALREPGRYLMYRTTEGGFSRRWLPEPYIQKLFQGSESLLPTPDDEPAREYERQFRLARISQWIIGVSVSVGLVIWMAAKRRGAPSATDFR